MDHHTGQGPAADAIAQQARATAAEGGDRGGGYAALKDAIEGASPDERSAAAKQLVDDPPAYQALHNALADLGIEP